MSHGPPVDGEGRLVSIDPTDPDPALIAEAGRRLRSGGVIAHPSDTVMGLAAAARHEGAVARMRALKGAADDRPFIVLIDEPARIDGLIHSMKRYVVDYIASFWPGPLTLILNARPETPCRGADGSVALRCPDHPLTQGLIRECAGLLTSTSANRTGDQVVDSGEAALAVFGSGEPGLALAFEATVTPFPRVASTIVDCRGDRPVLVREGAVKLEGVERR